jgi:hypothetical protein
MCIRGQNRLQLGPLRSLHLKCLGAEVICGGTPAPQLKSAGLCLSMMPNLDGVTDIVVVADPVVRRRTLRGRLTSLLLLRVSTHGP